MPRAAKAQEQKVLNLDEGVSAEDYAQALTVLRDQFEAFRSSQGWCGEFWTTIMSTMGPVFTYDSYNEVASTNPGNVATDAERATSLRNLRGRMLSYVGIRITLHRVNEMFRAAGLAEYAIGNGAGVPWRMSFPSMSLNVTSKTDPTAGIQEKFAAFLESIGDDDAAYRARRVYANELSDSYMVPDSDKVALLQL